MNSIIDKLNDGGPAFTYIIVLTFFVLIALFVRGILMKGEKYKTIELMKQISWFAVDWGFLGRTFGLIMIFDKVQAMGDVAPSVFADGLKIALVAPLCGILVFALTRLGIVVLISIQKNFKPMEQL